MKAIKFLLVPLCFSLLTGCELIKSRHDLELLKFEAVQETHPTELQKKSDHFCRSKSENKETIYTIDEDEKLSLKAVVKNEPRDSFVDMVIFSSNLDTYIVYNEGNGDYQCSSSTIYEDGLWVTNILLEYSPSDINGYLEISEITFLRSGDVKEKAFISDDFIKQVKYHKHSYGDWKVTLEPGPYSEGAKERQCIDCSHSQFIAVDSLSVQYSNGFAYAQSDKFCLIRSGGTVSGDGALIIPEYYNDLPVIGFSDKYSPSEDLASEVNTLYLSKNFGLGEIFDSEDMFYYISNILIMHLFKNLKSIIVDKENPNFCSIDGVLYSKDEKTLVCVPPLFDAEAFRVLKTVEKIDHSAFKGCIIKELIINVGATFIGAYAFEYMKAKKIYIPNTVVRTGYMCSYHCEATFYCQNETQPTGWDKTWNWSSDNGLTCSTVLWNQENDYWTIES